MAASQAADGQPAAANEPMRLESLAGIVGARGIEAALPAEKRAERQLIEPDTGNGRALWQFPWAHGQLACNSDSNDSNEFRYSRLPASPVTKITMSMAGSDSRRRRKVSRRTRFARLRSCARRNARLPTTRPSRAVCILFATALIRNAPCPLRTLAWRNARSKSLE
jgi:hypothetical protein